MIGTVSPFVPHLGALRLVFWGHPHRPLLKVLSPITQSALNSRGAAQAAHRHRTHPPKHSPSLPRPHPPFPFLLLHRLIARALPCSPSAVTSCCAHVTVRLLQRGKRRLHGGLRVRMHRPEHQPHSGRRPRRCLHRRGPQQPVVADCSLLPSLLLVLRRWGCPDSHDLAHAPLQSVLDLLAVSV